TKSFDQACQGATRLRSPTRTPAQPSSSARNAPAKHASPSAPRFPSPTTAFRTKRTTAAISSTGLSPMQTPPGSMSRVGARANRLSKIEGAASAAPSIRASLRCEEDVRGGDEPGVRPDDLGQRVPVRDVVDARDVGEHRIVRVEEPVAVPEILELLLEDRH